MSLLHDPARDLGMGPDVAAEHEERAPGARGGERLEHGRRVLDAGAVVEGDGDLRRRRGAGTDHAPEQAGVRRERRPRDEQQQQHRDALDDVARDPPDGLPDHGRDRDPERPQDYEASDDFALAHTGCSPARRSA
jgi:hypothetical protein